MAPRPTVSDLADALATSGGYVMEVLGRVLGGYRVRLWVPTERGARRLAAVALSAGWDVKTMPHYEGLDYRPSGFQVVVQFRQPVTQEALEAGTAAGELGAGE